MSDFREVTFSPIDKMDRIEGISVTAATMTTMTRGGRGLQHNRDHIVTPSYSSESTNKGSDDSGSADDNHSSSVYGASLNFINSIVGAGIIGQ